MEQELADKKPLALKYITVKFVSTHLYATRILPLVTRSTLPIAVRYMCLLVLHECTHPTIISTQSGY